MSISPQRFNFKWQGHIDSFTNARDCRTMSYVPKLYVNWFGALLSTHNVALCAWPRLKLLQVKMLVSIFFIYTLVSVCVYSTEKNYGEVSLHTETYFFRILISTNFNLSIFQVTSQSTDNLGITWWSHSKWYSCRQHSHVDTTTKTWHMQYFEFGMV